MTIKNDKFIRNSGIFSPCFPFTNTKTRRLKDLDTDKIVIIKDKIISKGISSYGYDLTCSNEFKTFKNRDNLNSQIIIDPKGNNLNHFETITTDEYIIPPNDFVLTRSVEYIRMPRNLVGFCMGKSTYARCGISANTTLIEPEWKGYLVIELSNTTKFPVKIYANEGIVQVILIEANDLCETSYEDRGGKYQNQESIQTSIV